MLKMGNRAEFYAEIYARNDGLGPKNPRRSGALLGMSRVGGKSVRPAGGAVSPTGTFLRLACRVGWSLCQAARVFHSASAAERLSL